MKISFSAFAFQPQRKKMAEKIPDSAVTTSKSSYIPFFLKANPTGDTTTFSSTKKPAKKNNTMFETKFPIHFTSHFAPF